MAEENKELITKVDAAKRQLRTAIQLWFQGGDAVSIHTLACAAHQIVHDLNRRKKGPDLLYDTTYIKDEFRRDYVGFLKREAGFFKHADRGKVGLAKSVVLNTRSSEVFMLMTLMGLKYLGESHDDVEAAYLWWFYLQNPHWLKDEIRAAIERIPADYISRIQGDKQEFFDTFLEIKQELSAI